MIDISPDTITGIVEKEVTLFLQDLGYKDYETVANDPELSLELDWLDHYNFEIKLFKLTNKRTITVELTTPDLDKETSN